MFMRSILGLAGALVAFAATAASAETVRPRLELVPTHVDPASVPMVVNSKIIFLNRCVGGCKLTSGYTDSRTNKSQIGAGTLSAFSFGDTAWNNVVNCVKSTFSRFNVEVTDKDPGPYVDHFEVMVAGSPGQIGLSSGIGGIAEYSCQSPGVCTSYLPDTIVFDFAAVYSGYPNRDLEICAVAAQEIAHTWTLDHVTDASDPMTYFDYSGMRQFKDNVQCGSDCVNGTSPFGLTCSGNAHTCMSTGTATQNEVQILTKLFGPAGAKAPTLTMSNPKNGSAQPAGFTINVDCQSSDGVQEVQYSIDGTLKTTQAAPPFSYPTPANLAMGSHRVTVLCASKLQAISTATADVIIGAPCGTDADCPAGNICYGSACIAGPDAAGGLGATCTQSSDCVNGACANDGKTMACVIPCDLAANACPDGFGCLDAGGGMGVCWVSDNSGCCDTSGRSAGTGPILLGLGFAAVFVTRRRRRNRR